MKMLFRKIILLALVAVIATLGVASLPLVGVSAMGANDSALPSKGQVLNARLELVWARQLRRHDRMGKVDAYVEKIQYLIDRATANGKDASAVQAALDAFTTALTDAKPIYESMNEIVNSHQGFDENGKVTDRAKAMETVQAMHEKFQEIRDTMNGTGKALHEAIKAFREANPRPRMSASKNS